MTRAALALLALAALLGLTGVSRSGADYAATSPAPGAFAAAADFNTVTAALADPGSLLHGTVALQATASSERGIARVRFESSPAGAGTWVTACTATAAPYSCDWATTGVADGLRDIRAVAIDQAGYQRASAVASSRRVDNGGPAVTLADPGAYLDGTRTLSASATDAAGVATLRIEYRAAGAASWTTLCSGSGSPRSCTLVTTTLAEGAYELRAVATDAAGNQAASAAISRPVDNSAPSVSLPALGPQRGTISVAIDAADGQGTGVASVTAEFRPAGGAWSQACVDTQAPFACDGLDTTTIPDGIYEARATAVDGTGRSTTSATISVRIDNTAPAATLTDPGTTLRDTISPSGGASDAGSGVASWTVQYRATGGGWTDACADTAAPWACTWDTTAVPDGSYDLRAVATDAAGNQTATSALTGRRIDNTPPAGAGVLTGNAGTAGRLEAGDWIRLTYTEALAPASVLAGWSGAAQAIRVTVTNSGSNDRMDFTTGSGARLNLVSSPTDLQLGADFVPNTATFNATVTQSAAAITITLGSRISGGLRTAGAGTIAWRPSAAATDLAGNAALTTTVTESGAADVDF